MIPKVRYHQGKWWAVIEWQTPRAETITGCTYPTWTERNMLGAFDTMSEALSQIAAHKQRNAEILSRYLG